MSNNNFTGVFFVLHVNDFDDAVEAFQMASAQTRCATCCGRYRVAAAR